MSNMIERNIFVLRDASSVAQPIEYVQGTNEVPILLHVRDYDIPTGSTARVYVEWPSTKGEYDESGVTIDGNDILIKPKDTLFSEIGKSKLQVCIVNGEKTLVTFSYPVMVKKNHVPGITIQSANHSDFLDEYISNMQSATDSANEAYEKAMQSANETNEALDAFKTALEGTVINDETPSDVTTYSSEKIEMFDIQTSTDTALYNTKPGGYRLLEMTGNTVQNGTPSPSTPQAIENTFDCVEMIQGVHLSTSGIFEQRNYIITSKNPIPCKQGDTLEIKTDKPYTRLVFVFYKGDTFVSNSVVNNASVCSVVVPSGVDNFHYNVQSETDVPITPDTVGKITLTVNGKYVGQFVEHGKNFLNLNTVINGFVSSSLGQSTNSAYRISEIYPIGEYVISWSNTSNGYIYIIYYDENKNIIKRDVLLSTNRLSTQVNQSAGKYFAICYTWGGDSGSEFVYDIQIEQGSVATPYEPYTEKVATFFLNEPLRATDRVVQKDGVWNENHKRDTQVFDGSENWRVADSTIDCFYFCTVEKAKRATTANAPVSYCDRYTFQKSSNANMTDKTFKIARTTSGTIAILYIKDLDCPTVEDFKAKLQANPITVEYELEEESFVPLDTESQIALNEMVTFDTVTHIEVDSKVKPSGISGEYGTSQVGAYTMECLNAKDIDRIEREEMKARLDELAVALVSQ